MDDDIKKSDVLDLGLAAFLASVDEPKPVVASVEVTKPEIIAAPSTVPSVSVQSTESSADFKRLADVGDWTELARISEGQLGDSDLTAKLWWVKAQLMLKAIPLEILAAPLEAVARELNRSDSPDHVELKGFCAELLQTVSGGVKSSDVVVVQALSQQGEELKKKPPAVEPAKLEVQAVNPSHRRNPSRRRLVFAVGPLVAASLAVFFVRSQLHPSLGDLTSSVEPILTEIQPQLELPAVEPISGLSHLDAVYYGLAEGEKEKPVDADLMLRSVSRALESDRVAATTSSKIGRRVEPRLPDSTGVVSGASQTGRRESFDVSGTKGERTRDLGNVGTPDDGVYTIDFPPFRGGKGVERERHENLSDRRSYVVIARTKVLEEPSYWSRSSESLEVGDRIEVDDSLGKWLKIRSRMGRIGYVLAQDAELQGALR